MRPSIEDFLADKKMLLEREPSPHQRMKAQRDAERLGKLPKHGSAAEAVKWALLEAEKDDANSAVEFLRLWTHGEFEVMHRKWPGFPAELRGQKVQPRK